MEDFIYYAEKIREFRTKHPAEIGSLSVKELGEFIYLQVKLFNVIPKEFYDHDTYIAHKSLLLEAMPKLTYGAFIDRFPTCGNYETELNDHYFEPIGKNIDKFLNEYDNADIKQLRVMSNMLLQYKY